MNEWLYYAAGLATPGVIFFAYLAIHIAASPSPRIFLEAQHAPYCLKCKTLGWPVPEGRKRRSRAWVWLMDTWHDQVRDRRPQHKRALPWKRTYSEL
jgi:hypothetical protein